MFLFFQDASPLEPDWIDKEGSIEKKKKNG